MLYRQIWKTVQVATCLDHVVLPERRPRRRVAPPKLLATLILTWPTTTMKQNTNNANTTSSTVAANSAGTPIVRVPRAGDRFRIVYDRNEEVPDNFLGFARPSW